MLFLISVGSIIGFNGLVHVGRKVYKSSKKQQLKRSYFKKSKIIKSTEICVICQEDYMEKSLCTELYCGHKYHKKCIRKWVCEKSTCPLCNKELKHKHSHK